MKTLRVLYFTALLLLFSCSSLRKSMIKTGENIREIAIHNAIMDFSNKCNLFKKDSVFHVSFKDSVFYAIIDYEKQNYVLDTIYADKILVGILGETNKIPYYSDAVIGSKGKLPSRYVEVKGKLFYWWDDNYPLTEETLSVLKKYNVLSHLLAADTFRDYDFVIDDAKKGADYYFCKNDLSKYKRIVTNIGRGYYKPPKLKCK